MSAVGMESSKVTVEYHDLSGVFPLISRDINARLPLRNLNWQSPPRPLRQIKSLHVDFVPDKPTQLISRTPASPVDSNGPNSLDIVRGSSDQRKLAVKERRHQIPGFRTSPYLKIYILRCDDREAYKENDRRKIREWIRDNAHNEGKREDHDGFEWMILHVVIPDTIAASEPRWRESAKDPDELKERKGGAKLIGKNTRTVFDRLRADFNDSSKSGYDRVAQIRLPKTAVPADLLPTPALAQTYEETAQERENAWNDLITKFKSLILGPFDRRVRQYEADIAEQEARRSLPGWNYCTFFIHKEGLAKALESVGLVEDALAIYDELSIGLETVLREMASNQAQGTATSFAAHTADFKDRISGLQEQCNNDTDKMTDEKRDAAALFGKDYRESIVRSDISVFDFICYIFSRQKAMILRLANARSVRMQLDAGANQEGGEDLVLTSEVCWRTSRFIHNAARTLRQDLVNGATPTASANSDVEIESLVCSWIWGFTGQVLEETAVPALLHITKLDSQDNSLIPDAKSKRPPMSIGLGANIHPQRTASLPGHHVSEPRKERSLSRPRTQDDTVRPISSSGFDPLKGAGLPGQAELATYRAELILMRRKMLEQLARRRRWYSGWASAHKSKQDRLEDVSLDENAYDSVIAENDERSTQHQILSPALKSALKTELEFQSTYESLTEAAIRHYHAATQSKSAETLLGDLAMLKCQQGQYENAISYFQLVLPLLATESWDSMELLALSTYAHCLKQLHKLHDYTQNTLTLLEKVVAKETARELPHFRLGGMIPMREGNETLDGFGLFPDVIASSVDLDGDITRPLKHFFSEVNLDRVIEHDTESDAFTLELNFRHVLPDDIELSTITAVLVGYEDPSQEIELAANGVIPIKPGMNKIALRAHTVAHGPFLIAKITLTAKRLHFVEEMQPSAKLTPLGLTGLASSSLTFTKPEKPPAFVYVYPADRAFHAEVRRSPSIRIDKPRHLEVVIKSWRNHIDTLEIRMKPNSAGLRLHLADATAEGIELAEGQPGPGRVALSGISAYHEGTVVIPYTVEQSSRDIAIRLDIRYQVAGAEFAFLHSARISNELPLDVDVNDVFQLDALCSNFTIRTTTQVPLAVIEAHLSDSPIYAVQAPPTLTLPLNVYRSQPINMVYKVSRKLGAKTNILKCDAALALGVLYQPADELLLSCLRQVFARDLEGSEFRDLHRLLVPVLFDRAQHFIQDVDLEMALLLGEFRTPGFDFIGWEELVGTLPDSNQSQLENWLRQWHVDHTMISIEGSSVQSAATQHITISVDVPNVDMVFGVSLNLLQPSSTKANPPAIVLGQPIRANLRIKNNASWSAKSIFPNVPTFKIHGEGRSQPSFVCDIGAESEAWAIGGQRRCHFTPQEGLEYHFSVLLLPLKLGIQHLPPVDVRRESSDPETTYDSADGPSFSCEAHYESAGEVVHVVRDMRTTKAHIEETPSYSSRPGTASTAAVG